MGGAMVPSAMARSLVHRFRAMDVVDPTQQAAATERLPDTDLDLAALMFGCLMGGNAAHEVGHFMADTFVPHAASGFMETGGDRSVARRTGMEAMSTTDPIVIDNGRARISERSPRLLRTLEQFLPINPPIDQAGARARGTVGSFAQAQAARGVGERSHGAGDVSRGHFPSRHWPTTRLANPRL